MKLKEKNHQLFRVWAMKYLSEEREASSKSINEKLEKDIPKLIKSIKKVAKKSGVVAYVGRYLLPQFRKEGWLVYSKGIWSVKIIPERCAQCFEPIDEVYLIDCEENHFCCEDCVEEFDEFNEGYSPYWDMYMSMYYDFRDMYPKIEGYKKLQDCKDEINPLTHIEFINYIKDIEDIVYDCDYEEIVYDEGGDGVYAAEIYRMYNILKEAMEEFWEINKVVTKNRTKEKTLYSIIIDHDYLATEGRKNKVVKIFIKKNSKYLMENRSNTWITSEVDKRHEWYDELKKDVDEYLNYKNYYECPICGAISEEKYTKKAIDDYHYCEECFEDVKDARGFEWREEY